MIHADPDAERAVLASAILDPERVAELRDVLTADCFVERKNADVWQAIQDVHAAGEPVDQLLVRSRLLDAGKLDDDHLLDVTGRIPMGASIGGYAARLRDLATTREVLSACRLVLKEAEDGIEDHRSFCDRAERAVSTANRTAMVRTDPVTPGEAVRSLITKARGNDGRWGHSTGLVDLDQMTGGLQPGQMWIVAARPGDGKSALSTNFATSLATEGIRVALCSLEMGADEIAARMVAAHTGKNLRQFTNAGPATVEALTASIPWADNLEVFIVDDGGLNVNDIRRSVRALEARGRAIGCVVVDYLQLMRPVEHVRGRSREQEVSEMSRELKLLARAFSVPVVVLSQLNRQSEHRGGPPKLSDLRESGAIEQDADVVLLLHHDRNDDGEITESRCIVGKNRNGPTGYVRVRFDQSCVRFSNFAGGYG